MTTFAEHIELAIWRILEQARKSNPPSNPASVKWIAEDLANAFEIELERRLNDTHRQSNPQSTG